MKLARLCFRYCAVAGMAQGDRFRLKVDKAKTDGEIETPRAPPSKAVRPRAVAHSAQPSFDCMSARGLTHGRGAMYAALYGGAAWCGAKTDGLSYGKVVLLLGLQPILFKT